MKIENTNLKVLQVTEISCDEYRNIPFTVRNMPLNELDEAYGGDPNYLTVNRIVRDQKWKKVKGSKYLGKQIVTTTFVEGTITIYIILAELI